MTGADVAAMIRKPVRALGFGAMTAGMLAAFELHQSVTPRAQRPTLLEDYRRKFLSRTLGIFGVDLTVTPAMPSREPSAPSRLVVSNHRSALDIGILLHLFGGNIVSRAD